MRVCVGRVVDTTSKEITLLKTHSECGNRSKALSIGASNERTVLEVVSVKTNLDCALSRRELQKNLLETPKTD